MATLIPAALPMSVVSPRGGAWTVYQIRAALGGPAHMLPLGCGEALFVRARFAPEADHNEAATQIARRWSAIAPEDSIEGDALLLSRAEADRL